MLNSLSWAIFLASSWTWCIGMFFPALLYRDFGSISWFVFTIPNVIGAASIPWILRNDSGSDTFVARHNDACYSFSVVTILFQAFFIGWIATCLPWQAVAVLSLILMAMWSTSQNDRMLVSWGTGIWGISLSAFLYFLTTHGFRIEEFSPLSTTQTIGLLGLSAVFLMGFAFCPYLDITFHKVRRQFPVARAKIVFGAGFFIFFLIMLLFTLAYSPSLLPIVYGKSRALTDAGMFAVLVHIVLQAGFTATAHHRCAQELLPNYKGNAVLKMAAVAFIVPFALQNGYLIFAKDVRELIYIGFIGFYGFMAPTYLWIYTLNQPLDGKPLLLPVTILLALPFFAIGFLSIVGPFGYLLLVGSAIVFLSRFIISSFVARPTAKIQDA